MNLSFPLSALLLDPRNERHLISVWAAYSILYYHSNISGSSSDVGIEYFPPSFPYKFHNRRRIRVQRALVKLNSNLLPCGVVEKLSPPAKRETFF